MKMHISSTLFISFFINQKIDLKNKTKKVKIPFSWSLTELIEDLILAKGQLTYIGPHINDSK